MPVSAGLHNVCGSVVSSIVGGRYGGLLADIGVSVRWEASVPLIFLQMSSSLSSPERLRLELE